MADPQTFRKMLARRDTAELLEIWNKYDENEWQPAAFKAIASILEERGELLPEQKAKHKYLLHELTIQRAREEDERQRQRRRNASKLAPYLGSIAALVPFTALLFVVILIYPEPQWPDTKKSPVLGALIMGLALGIYGVFWKWAASIIWRILAGHQDSDNPSPDDND